jgi:hypothetical protein
MRAAARQRAGEIRREIGRETRSGRISVPDACPRVGMVQKVKFDPIEFPPRRPSDVLDRPTGRAEYTTAAAS